MSVFELTPPEIILAISAFISIRDKIAIALTSKKVFHATKPIHARIRFSLMLGRELPTVDYYQNFIAHNNYSWLTYRQYPTYEKLVIVAKTGELYASTIKFNTLTGITTLISMNNVTKTGMIYSAGDHPTYARNYFKFMKERTECPHFTMTKNDSIKYVKYHWE